MKVLVTGGCGYVGSNIVAALGEHGYEIAILDNLATSSVEIVEDLRKKIGDNLDFNRLTDEDLLTIMGRIQSGDLKDE